MNKVRIGTMLCWASALALGVTQVFCDKDYPSVVPRYVHVVEANNAAFVIGFLGFGLGLLIGAALAKESQ